MGTELPPVEGVVADPGGPRQSLGVVDEVGVVGHRPRRARARPGPQRELAGRGEARVAPVPERRVGRERLEQRQVAAHPVEGPDCGLRVRHADVDVKRGDRRHQSVAQLLGDEPVSTLVADLGRVLGGGRMRRRAQEPDAGVEHAAAQVGEHGDRLARRCLQTSVISSTSHACTSPVIVPRSASPTAPSTRSRASSCLPSSASAKKSSSSTPSAKGRFLAKARLAKRIRHPRSMPARGTLYALGPPTAVLSQSRRRRREADSSRPTTLTRRKAPGPARARAPA